MPVVGKRDAGLHSVCQEPHCKSYQPVVTSIVVFSHASVVSIEDPFDQDDWAAWKKFTASSGIQVVGDDLTVTNPKRIAKAVEEKSCNCLLLKVNQIGSVTESLQA